MNICIGIISYLPDEQVKRNIRKEQLLKLIDKCNEIFNLPIIIVAQNWKDFTIDNTTIYRYKEPIGIINARNTLRKKFLSLDYDYIIMLDDDCTLDGDKVGGEYYKKEITSHPGMFGTFNGTLLKLFAISKEMFSLLDFGDGYVESGDYFEDILFVNTLLKKYKNKHFQFNKSYLSEKSNNYNDPNSTWYYGQYNKRDIGDRTRSILSSIS